MRHPTKLKGLFKLFNRLLPFLLLCAPFSSGAAPLNYSFKQISIEEGLSQSTVNCILRDRYGMVWIGTRSGLNTFDKGETQTFFNRKEDLKSLPGNNVAMLAQDSLMNIWVGTNAGLATFTARESNFTRQLDKAVYCSVRIPGGMLFGGSNALYRYRYETGSFEQTIIAATQDGNPTDDFRVVSMQANGRNILVATNQRGLYNYSPQTGQITKLPIPDLTTLLTMHLAADGALYLSSFKNGLYCYDLDGTLREHYTTANSGLSNNIVMSMVERGDDLWLATDGGGISILNRYRNTISSIKHIPGNPHSLPVNSITVLYTDDDNNLWAGSVRGGIFSIRETFIRTFGDVNLSSPNGITERAVISLFEDNDRMLWIGTDGGGINRYDPARDTFRHYPSTYGDKVISITDLSDRKLIVSLFAEGTYIFDKQTGGYRPFVIVDPATDAEEKRSDFMPLIHRVGPDKVYVLSQNAYSYRPSTRKFTTIGTEGDEKVPGALNLVYSDSVRSFAFTGNRIYEITQRDDILHPTLMLDNTEIIHAACFRNGQLWIGSDLGLSRYDLSTQELIRVDTRLFDNVSYLLLDGDRLWICAHNRLFSYDTKRGRFLIWSDADGFIPNEILFMYQAPSRSENLYLGGANGLVIIDKHISSERDFPPHILLRDITLNGRSVTDRIRDKEIHIPSNYASLSIKIDSYEKDIFRATLYRYVITGQNQQRFETYDRTLDLSSLASGEYTISVSCNTKSGDWVTPVTLIHLIVDPPWYRTWWAILAFIVFFTGSLVAAILVVLRNNENRLKWKMKEYQQQVNESKIQFLVNVSHELRTPLTLIYAPLKRVIQRLQPDNPLWESLNDIFRQAGQMKDLINMVLDINKMENGGMRLDVSSRELNPWMESIAHDFERECAEKNIRLDIVPDPRIGLVNFDLSKCKIILSNLLMNALKFSPENSTITLKSELRDASVRISVIDEGIGLHNVDPERLFTRFYQGEHGQKGSGIGLSYAKQLIERHGGTINAMNNPTKGATFYFELPLSETEPAIVSTPSDVRIPDEESSIDTDFLHNFSILVVEDNPDFRSFLKNVLRESFKNVYAAEDGVEGLEMVESRKPDLVVSDVMMPRMDGYELCRRIKEKIEISHIPVILLTARGDAESIATGYKLGADFYLSKPFEMDMLLTILQNQLRSVEKIRSFYRNMSGPVSAVETTISYADEQFMTRLNKTVYDNIENPSLDVAFLARELAMGRTSLYNKVKELTDMGVNDFINRLRIERGCELLTKTELSITEVAYKTGFAYPRYFSSLFKQLKGVTPSQYRTENRSAPNNAGADVDE